MNINFIYEITNGKYIIGEKKENKLYNKRYYFGDLGKLDIKNNTEIYLEDTYFDFQLKNFIYNNKKKISIKNIKDNLEDFQNFIGYNILNIFINGKKSNFILGKYGEITYDIGTFNLNKLKYNKILKYFGKNINLNIFPKSFFLVSCMQEDIQQGSILYFLNNNIKTINIEKNFYKNIEKLDIGIDEFHKNIKNIFGKRISNIENMSNFNQKVYTKELEKFLEPIVLFLKKNLQKENIYIIGDFKYVPELLKTLGNKLNKNIIPIKINNKTFKNIEEADIYCILKQKN